MVYFEGAESYLVPYAVRTFFNSLASQRKLFGYEPDTDITVLLADFEDWGNAGVSVVPRSTMMVQVVAAQFRLRDDGRQRADEHDHEPRARARRDDGPGDGPRSAGSGGCSAAR